MIKILVGLLQEIRNKGKASLNFKPGIEFQREFDSPWSNYFDDHVEFDEFVIKILSKCKELDKQFPAEWLILKSIDRSNYLIH